VHGNETRGLGLCASTCTLRVYWLVNRRVHPGTIHGNLRRGFCASPSVLLQGDKSRVFCRDTDKSAEGCNGVERQDEGADLLSLGEVLAGRIFEEGKTRLSTERV